MSALRASAWEGYTPTTVCGIKATALPSLRVTAEGTYVTWRTNLNASIASSDVFFSPAPMYS
eukprot:CAMPEP_0206252034 /NCGR_PEP_ID=MMETSP0047_2-20121206/22353_1 /ASSEMBLY_ACC=CAM_ASM_000192 /TAXON_ID=195065 /ORGANISM="Chroomonas mesostigmatica_cf, Strain CCMP1168" /LENGTH=61 /DNA_ID=CAMNT_0053678049 /DNA_START=213 /DNA_END=398 /DNA_ORIENTATION=+